MKVLFDLKATQATTSNKRHGGGKYAEVIIKRMLEKQLDVLCFYDSNFEKTDLINHIIQSNEIEIYDINKEPIEKIVEERRIDRIFSSLPVTVSHVDNCEVLGTIHGLREIELPLDWFFFKYKNQGWKDVIKFFLRKFVPIIGIGREYKRIRHYYDKNNFKFITVSNHSSNALKCYFPEYSDKDIPVFYSPSTSSKVSIDKRVYSDKYFFMVSGNRWAKNNLRAIIALDRLFSAGLLNGYRVKVAGVKSGHEYRYRIKNPNNFEFLDYVEESVLEQLYHDAYCFVYPSLNEGFGYPPLEAMRYGVPVIASPFSSIPEVCQNAAIYANPFSVEELMNRILQMTNEQVHDQYSKRSLLQFKYITDIQMRDLDRLIDYLYQEKL